MQQNNRLTEQCPRQLKNLPNCACPLAMLRIEIVQSGKRELPETPGCPWYVNDANYHYCWFVYADERQNRHFGVHTTKEIAQQLALTSGQIEKAEKTALEKLFRSDMDSELLIDITECIAEAQRGIQDATIYSVGSLMSSAEIEKLLAVQNIKSQ